MMGWTVSWKAAHEPAGGAATALAAATGGDTAGADKDPDDALTGAD
jgi:hypothetical protein